MGVFYDKHNAPDLEMYKNGGTCIVSSKTHLPYNARHFDLKEVRGRTYTFYRNMTHETFSKGDDIYYIRGYGESTA